MLKKLLIAAMLLIPGLAFGQGSERIAQSTVENNGFVKVLSGAQVTVTCVNGCSGPAQLYQEFSLSVPQTNPFYTDSNGNYFYYATPGLTFNETICSPATLGCYTQVVTMPGGNGSTVTPCGVLYDVQINDPLGMFGCDSGIFQEFPISISPYPAHTMLDNYIQGNRQVGIGDATHTGVLDIWHSSGSAHDADFTAGLNSTFSTSGGGYGIDVPDSPAVGVLGITALTPGSDGRLPTSWRPFSVSTIYLAGTDSGTDGTNYVLTSGNLNANSNPCPAALTTGVTANIVPLHTSSSTTPTFQLCGLGSPAVIVKNGVTGETALLAADIYDTGTAGVIRLTWNAATSHWDLQNPSVSGTTEIYLADNSPLDITNGQFPTPCPGNNCIRTLDLQGPSMFFGGPLPPTDPRSAIVQDKWCAITPATGVDVTCTFPSAFVKGDTWFADTYIDCGSACDPSGTMVTTTLGPVHVVDDHGWSSGDSPVVSASWGTADVLDGQMSVRYRTTVSSSGWFGNPYLHIVELRGTQTKSDYAFTGSDVTCEFPFASVSPGVNNITIIGDAILGNTSSPLLSGGYGVWTPYNASSFMASLNENSAGTYTPGLSVPSCTSTPTGALFSWAFTNDVFGNSAQPTFRSIFAADLSTFIPDQTSQTGKFLTSNGDNTLPMSWTSPTFVSSIQFKNSSVNFGSPMTGAGSLNCSGCTFSGTAPNFTITTSGGGPTFPVTTKTTTYTATTADFTSCNTIRGNSASVFTVTLVAAGSQPTNGQCVWVVNSSTGTVKVVPNGQNLNGDPAQSLTVFPQGAALIVSDGTNYFGYLMPGNAEDANQVAVLGLRYDFASALGTRNTIIGPVSGGSTGTDNVLVGYEANYASGSGARNTDIGSNSGTGGCNSCTDTTFVGYEAGTGSNGSWTSIGSGVGSGNYAGTGSVTIGAVSTVNGNSSHTTNYLNIGNFIAGDMAHGNEVLICPATTIASNDCGSTSQGTVTAGGNDHGGEVNAGTATVTSCAVTFAQAFTAAPICVCSSESNTVAAAGLACSASTTKVTATSAGNLDSTKWTYHCFEVSTSNNPIP